MLPTNVDDTGTAATLAAHELGAFELGMVAQISAERGIDRDGAAVSYGGRGKTRNAETYNNTLNLGTCCD